MPIGTIIAAGALLIAGTAFALFLGIASTRIDHEREEQAGHGG